MFSSSSRLAFVPRTAALAAFAALTAVASLAALLTPSSASAAPAAADAHKPARTARITKGHPCTKAPVSITAGTAAAAVSLTKCDGTANPSGVDELSVLARPGSAAKPAESITALDKVRGPELAPGIRRIDTRLVEELERTVLHFSKDGDAAHVVIVSGYRPKSAGSYHSSGRALDFHIEGVPNADLVAFCKTLPDTGCGYYPNSAFVHMDVRPSGSGHVAWVDTSRPGEPPHYVSPGGTAEAPAAEAKNDKAKNDKASKATGAAPTAGAAASDHEVAIGEVAAHEGSPASADDVAADKLPPLPKASHHHSVAAAMMVPVSP
jgi:uncharacterized protein YcbK (DUF882 family)